VFVQASELNVPVNWTTPFPSVPLTVFPNTVIGRPPNWLFGPPASNVGVALKLNDATAPGAPRLQIAKTGFTTGDAKVMVFVPVKLPFRKMASPTVLGDAVDVPPMNELLGAQMGLVPLSTVLSTSPAYDIPTPVTEPDAVPGAPAVELVQSVQVVTADAGTVASNVALMTAPISTEL
jgi:hypothetical protein